GVLGESGAFKSVDDVVVYVGMFGSLGKQAAENGDGFGAAGRAGFFVREGKAAHDHQGEIEFRFDFAGVSSEQGANAFDEGFLRLLGVRTAAGGDSGDVHLLDAGGLAGDLGQLNGFESGGTGARGSGWN